MKKVGLRSVATLACVGLAVVLLSGCEANASADPSASATTTAQSPVSGNFAGKVSIGNGRELYLRCAGTGSPTVVLESGIHDSSDPWTIAETQPPLPKEEAVFPALAKRTHVCMYDRPGTIRYASPAALTTRSTPVAMPRTLPSMVSDLHALLTSAKIPGPYVLVGHSYGGMIVRLFAQTHPNDVAGLVLVDAFGTNIEQLFGSQWARYTELLNQPGTALDKKADFETVDVNGAIRAIVQGPPLPAVPLVVLSKTEPFATAEGVPSDLTQTLEKVWPAVQTALVELEPQTPHVFVTGSDHYVQMNDPDLVTSMVELVIGRR
ncbi:alpha/beta fold hydrolase [Rathayibacter soli]|uniref:alpha/beta fold hydrolase n=1 Tax=Rathayibacter soli TaxID=3144168 RepID=UPI0027E405C7|nr:alpha/beta hydrolase [Glaciibacter superstes]